MKTLCRNSLCFLFWVMMLAWVVSVMSCEQLEDGAQEPELVTYAAKLTPETVRLGLGESGSFTVTAVLTRGTSEIPAENFLPWAFPTNRSGIRLTLDSINSVTSGGTVRVTSDINDLGRFNEPWILNNGAKAEALVFDNSKLPPRHIAFEGDALFVEVVLDEALEEQVAELKDGEFPQISVRSILDFGSVEVGNSVNLNLSIRNKSPNEALTLTSLEFVDSEDRNFSLNQVPLPTSILQKTMIGFDVLFDPESPGFKSSQLRIESNDPKDPVVFVSLRGRAL